MFTRNRRYRVLSLPLLLALSSVVLPTTTLAADWIKEDTFWTADGCHQKGREKVRLGEWKQYKCDFSWTVGYTLFGLK